MEAEGRQSHPLNRLGRVEGRENLLQLAYMFRTNALGVVVLESCLKPLCLKFSIIGP